MSSGSFESLAVSSFIGFDLYFLDTPFVFCLRMHVRVFSAFVMTNDGSCERCFIDGLYDYQQRRSWYLQYGCLNWELEVDKL